MLVSDVASLVQWEESTIHILLRPEYAMMGISLNETEEGVLLNIYSYFIREHLRKEGKVKNVRLIDADELNKFPIRLGHYDKEHGSEVFVFGIESVLEYAEYLPTVSAVPVSELLSLRDNLYEDNLITMRGLRDLNMLIGKYEGGKDHALD